MISEVGFMEKGVLRKVAKIRNRGTIMVLNNRIVFKYERGRDDIEIFFSEISDIVLKNWLNLKIHLKNGDIYTLSCSADEMVGFQRNIFFSPVKYLRRKNTALYNSLKMLLKEYKEKIIPEVSYCQICGAKILDDVGDFCSKCGAKIK